MVVSTFGKSQFCNFNNVNVICVFQGWLTPFQEAAVAAADQAGAAMKEGAQNAAEVIKEMQHTTRIKLSVEIQAPIIIVPQSSKSDEAFLANLGKCCIFACIF